MATHRKHRHRASRIWPPALALTSAVVAGLTDIGGPAQAQPTRSPVATAPSITASPVPATGPPAPIPAVNASRSTTRKILPQNRKVAVFPTLASAKLDWKALAGCESGGNPRSVNSAGAYYGLYQFSVSTWRSVGGAGLPDQAGAAEQTYRAELL